MDISVGNSAQDLTEGTAVAVPYFESQDSRNGDGGRGTLPSVTGLESAMQAAQRAASQGRARTSLYDCTLLIGSEGRPDLVLVGAGKRDEISRLLLMRLASAAARYALKHGYTRLAMVDPGTGAAFDFGHAAAEGAARAAINPGVLKSQREQQAIENLTLITEQNREQAQEGARIGQIVGESAAISAELVNLPPNDLTPASFATRAEQLAQQYGLECEVLDENRMRELGMGSLLGVAQGSAQPPRLIRLHYSKGAPKARLALVGKGLTFDSGGLSIKPADAMMTMKSDMGGAAAVAGGMVAVARLGFDNIEVTGYVGATENMPGGAAMRPGDVLRAMNGETIEVLNTDAEGRLVLADVLSYAVKEGATHIVDFATLTGAAIVALGHAATLAAGRPQEWVERVVYAADRGMERAWPMPLYPDYREAMNSEVADIKNVGGRPGGALTASAFLSDFVGDTPWTHLDIAGTAFADKASAWRPEGGTGVGVGTIASLVYELSRG